MFVSHVILAVRDNVARVVPALEKSSPHAALVALSIRTGAWGCCTHLCATAAARSCQQLWQDLAVMGKLRQLS